MSDRADKELPFPEISQAIQSRRNIVRLGVGALLMPSVGVLLSACGGGGSTSGGFLPVLPTSSTPPGPAPASIPQTPNSPAAEVKKVSSFGLVALPDTQFYSRYGTQETGDQFGKQYGSEPYLAQTTWIAANASALKIPFVMHLGDVVDQCTHSQQWQVADTAMKALEDGQIPYSICAGNHDVLSTVGYDEDPINGTDATRDLTQEPYLQWFGADRAKKQKTFGNRDASGFHEYHIFEAEGQRFLVLSLSWRVSDEGIAWAKSMLNLHPTLPTILVSHELIAIANDGFTPQESSYGLMLWDKLIKSSDQIFMTLNGHIHGASHLTKFNEFGNAVEEMVVDYQMAYQGGNALMRYYEIDLTNNQIRVSSFSPWVAQKPRETLNQFDNAILSTPNERFVINMNFSERFSGFNRIFKAAAPVNEPLTEKAITLALNGYVPAAQAQAAAPANAEDYPHVAETVAHWRFVGGTIGTALSDGQVIADKSPNGNALTRGSLGGTAQLEDLQWSSDKHRLSAAPGSVQFLNSGPERVNYFLTAVPSAMNALTFDAGYTIEAFIKIGANWTAAKNAWMVMMSRAGRRGNLTDFSGDLPQSPPLQFAISNLREVQWEVIADQEPAQQGAGEGRSSRANWSGEVMVDTWMHIAVVNDAATQSTTMYVEGAPILRNTVDTVGLANLGDTFAWTIGGGYWNGGGPGGAFLGNIGEIRIVSKPLLSTQWLTARA